MLLFFQVFSAWKYPGVRRTWKIDLKSSEINLYYFISTFLDLSTKILSNLPFLWNSMFPYSTEKSEKDYVENLVLLYVIYHSISMFSFTLKVCSDSYHFIYVNNVLVLVFYNVLNNFLKMVFRILTQFPWHIFKKSHVYSILY